MSKEIGSVIKNVPKKKTQDQMALMKHSANYRTR